MPADWVRAYLDHLRLEPEPPGLAALTRLVDAHCRTLVFENVTAILRRARQGDGPVPPVDPDALLASWRGKAGGGVCFDLAPMFRRLLDGLGYRTRPILAQISFPGSHHATVVDLDGADHLVDVGGGAPLWRPFRLDETHEVRHAGLGFRVRPLEAARHLQERFIDVAWQPHCRYDLTPADDAARDAAYQRHQLAGETWVVGSLTMVRVAADAVYRLRDDELVVHREGGKSVERLTSRADFRRVAAEVYGLPGLPVDAALDALEAIRASAPRA